MKIERVQYDGEGNWLDVSFDNDSRKFRFDAEFLHDVASIAVASEFCFDMAVYPGDVKELPL